MKSSDLFFASGESRGFSSVLREVQGYLSKEYSGLVTAGEAMRSKHRSGGLQESISRTTGYVWQGWGRRS